MRRFLILPVIIAMLLPCAVNAADKKPQPAGKTVLLVFGAPAGGKAVTDNEIAAEAVLNQIRAAGRFQLVTFNPELPVFARAVADGRITKDALTDTSDTKVAARIAGIAGANYALNIITSVVPVPDSSDGSKVVTTLDLTQPDGKHWTARAESDIAQAVAVKRKVYVSFAASTAASAAVSSLIIQVFGQNAANLDIGAAAVQAPVQTQADNSDRDIDADYTRDLARADAYISRQDFPNAIYELREAVNLKPYQSEPRLKLAKTYLGLGMTAEGLDEARSALLFNKNDVSLHEMLVKLYISNGDMTDAASECAEIVKLEPKNLEALLNLGDAYWNLGRMNDAEAAYKEGITLDPQSPDPHERLQKLYVAQKKYAPAFDEMYSYKLLSPGAKADDVVAQLIQDEFTSILGKLDEADNEFKQGKTTREDYYQESQDTGDRISALDKFISKQNVPDSYKKAFPHAVLAVSLAEQANGYTISYLETEKQYYSDQAGLLRTEAKNEFGLYSKELALH